MTTRTTDVVIVGGGIAGITTAYYLAKEGIASTVIERDGLASHASGFAYGGLSGGIPNGPTPNQAIIQRSMDLYKDLAPALAEETSVDIQYQDRPAIRIALTDDEAKELSKDLAWQQAQPGYKVEWLDGDGVRKLEPRVNPETVGGLYIEGGKDVEPYRLTLSLAEAAEKMGVTIRTGNVLGVHRHEDAVRGVAIEGEQISAQAVVLAMGPWSSAITEWTGVNIPIRPLKGQIIRLKAAGDPYSYSIGHLKNYAMTKPADDLVWCGTTEEDADFDEGKTTESRDKIIDSTVKMLPDLADAQLVLQTACLRPVSSDNAPVLGKIPGIDGLYIATGGGRQGIMMGPAMGRTIAELIAFGSAELDLAAYDPGRFQE